MNVKDKVVIITGSGGGIGLAAARAFAHGQAHVLITGRRGQALEEIASREQRIKAFVADVSNPAERPVPLQKLSSSGDALMYSSITQGGVPMALAHASVEHVQAIYAVNTIGPTLLAAAAVPHLEKSRGAIVNISSSLGTKAVAGFADYAASKAALEHLTRCWAVELAPKGVRVNVIAPGPVESTFLRDRMGYSDAEVEAIKTHERSVIPLGRRGVPEDVARWIVALASNDADWVTGQVLGIDGGFTLA